MQYTIRQAYPQDLETLDKIYTENMRGYVELHYSWNPDLFKQNYASQNYQVIELDSQIIGFLKIMLSKANVYLGEIQITKKFQNLGIGTKIIKKIIKEAQLNRQRLWLRVIRGNPAEKLYRRLGFTTFASDSTHIKLEIKE
ncbi:MAG: GNAT family N-acetyltransferase [Cyanobacteria bacterium J06621_15]